MGSNLRSSDDLRHTRDGYDGLQPTSDGLQPTIGFQPTCGLQTGGPSAHRVDKLDGFTAAPNLLAMASNLVAMASFFAMS